VVSQQGDVLSPLGRREGAVPGAGSANGGDARPGNPDPARHLRDRDGRATADGPAAHTPSRPLRPPSGGGARPASPLRVKTPARAPYAVGGAGGCGGGEGGGPEAGLRLGRSPPRDVRPVPPLNLHPPLALHPRHDAHRRAGPDGCGPAADSPVTPREGSAFHSARSSGGAGGGGSSTCADSSESNTPRVPPHAVAHGRAARAEA
jgi:hypothetical protein